MATVAHNFMVGQTVFHMTEAGGVKEAIVKTVDISIGQSGTFIKYNITYTKTAASLDVYQPSLYDDIDLALAAYKNIVLA